MPETPVSRVAEIYSRLLRLNSFLPNTKGHEAVQIKCLRYSFAILNILLRADVSTKISEDEAKILDAYISTFGDLDKENNLTVKQMMAKMDEMASLIEK